MKKKTPLLGVKLTGGLEEEMTSWAGVSLAIELWRKSGAMEITEGVLPQKKSSKGLTPGQIVESFIPVIPSPRIKSSGSIEGSKPSPDMGLYRGGTTGMGGDL